jgi:hypothetical protein
MDSHPKVDVSPERPRVPRAPSGPQERVNGPHLTDALVFLEQQHLGVVKLFGEIEQASSTAEKTERFRRVADMLATRPSRNTISTRRFARSGRRSC